MTEKGGYLNRREALSKTLAIGCTASALFDSHVLSAMETESMMDSVNPRLFSFVGGSAGQWRVVSSTAIVGEPMPEVSHLEIVNGSVQISSINQWVLRGVTSNERYATRDEKNLLLQKQAPIGRPLANLCALIPIRKNAAWWSLTQDERRAIFEERSHHTSIGLKYLPAIARRLHHCRDLAEKEPFDFLTLFDYEKSDEAAFDDMLSELRATEEWKFIDREVDIRLVKS